MRKAAATPRSRRLVERAPVEGQRKKIEIYSAGCGCAGTWRRWSGASWGPITTSRCSICTKTMLPVRLSAVASGTCRAWWWTVALHLAAQAAVTLMRLFCGQHLSVEGMDDLANALFQEMKRVIAEKDRSSCFDATGRPGRSC
jgi:hypothetical protein